MKARYGVLAVGSSVLALASARALAAEVLVEAEGFADRGGWVVDQQFVDVMGSPYLLAHGMGVRVANASTTAVFPQAGTYRVWVRTKDWVPDFVGPGTFGVLVDGAPLAATFGEGDYGWSWQDGGTVELAGGAAAVELAEATGFEGRCDAIYFTTDLAATPPNDLPSMKPWRRALLGLPATPPLEGEFDLVVVGGGIAGCCASIAAARLGLTVALVHDRPFLGGNASQEVRVHTLGETDRIVGEIDTAHYANGSAESIVYDTRRHDVIDAEPNISLFCRWRAFDVETAAARIVAVYAKHTESGDEKQFRAPLFVDSTGDGWIGFWAGAQYRTGRESQAEFGESLAPAAADNMKMGNSLLWNSVDAGSVQTFPAVPWAMDVALDYSATSGEWFWEYGIDPALDTIYDAEDIRDHLFRAIYGSFANAKGDAANDDLRLQWVAYVAGKRESRRLVGDYILKEDDVRNPPGFVDGVVHESRDIDIHYRKPGPYDFLSDAQFTPIGRFWIPFRCLYSVNVENLMMAGRCFSATHVGLGSPRVMNTCGQMGVAVGCGAFLCKKYATTPRGVYQNHIQELKDLLAGEWPDPAIKVTNIVDNADAAGVVITGTWQSSTSDSGYYGTDYIHDQSAGKGTKSVRFTPNLAEAGTYNVYLRWTSSTNRPTNVPVDVTHAAGTVTVTVNQQADGGKWMLLGAWDFEAGTSGDVLVRTGGTDGFYVIADAVRFARPRVEMPVIDPAAGTYQESVQVTLTCPAAGAEIRYTTDGSEPAAASPLYAGPFTLTSSATVKAVAFKDGLAESVTVSAAFVVTDATPGIARGGGCVAAGGSAVGLLGVLGMAFALRRRASRRR